MKLSPIFLLLAAFSLSACSVAAIQKHQPHFRNTRELSKVKGTFRVAEVKATETKVDERLKSTALSCRLTTFNMPSGLTVASYVKEALSDELDAAEKIHPANGTPITVVVKGMESDTSSLNKGNWTLDFDYLVAGKTHNVKTVTEFESAYNAGTACRNTADALTVALTENFAGLYKKLPH